MPIARHTSPLLTAFTIVLIACMAQLVAAPAAHADDAQISARSSSTWGADFEIDPTAYVLGGHSLHVGITRGSWRLDLGNFAMDVPEALHGNDGMTAGFAGYGAKLQWFPLHPQSGLFVGVEAAVARVTVVNTDNQQSDRFMQINAGAQAGWRWMLPRDFFATLWLGVGRAFAPDEVAVGGKTFKNNALTLFPALHIGKKF